MQHLFRFRHIAFVLAVLLSLSTGARAQTAFDDPGARGQAGQGGDLKPVTDKVEAGGVALGGATQVVVLFRNEDSKPIKTGAINLYPSSNISASIGENQCAADAIQPGEVCAISISVKGLQQGKYRIEMLMRHDGRAKLLTSTINGDVESSGDDSTDLVSDIETIPTAIDFGNLDKSRTQVKAVVLRNKTSKTIKIEDIEIEAGSQSGFSVNANCGELQTGAACVASVTWSPEQKGPSTGTLIVKHNGATGVSTIELKGSYDPDVATTADLFPEAIPGKGLLVSSQEQIDFGGGVSQSSSMTVSLVNVGDVPLTLTAIRMTNSENGVRAEPAGCRAGSVLAPLEACPLTLTWEPVREGSIVDDVQISHTGARGILVMPLRGGASKAVNKDTKAIMIGGDVGAEAIIDKIQPLSLDEVVEAEVAARDIDGSSTGQQKQGSEGGKEDAASASKKSSSASKESPAARVQDVRGILDGYTLTSYSVKRAIVSGPGGSRVVYDGEQAVIGGVLWTVKMRPSAVEFQNGKQKVLLLFDRSLSSINTVDGQSGGGGYTPSVTTTTSSGTSSSSAATP